MTTLFHCPCRTGRLQVDETTVQISAFKQFRWSINRSDVTAITKERESLMVDLTLYTAQASYPIHTLTRANAAAFIALFPAITVGRAQAKGQWYMDDSRRTYVATYRKVEQAQAEMEEASRHGWLPQGSASATDGHINVGRTMTKFVFTGGIGLMTGASRSKGTITITYVRSPEWLTQQEKKAIPHAI